jgi:peptide/nickel transport system substrate-binding protein
MADSADPNPYLAFLPGGLVGLRAGWPAGADPSLETLGIQAATTGELPIRAQLFQLMQGQLNAEGPFFPLLQPGKAIVATKDIATIPFNPIWSIDLAAVSG